MAVGQRLDSAAYWDGFFHEALHHDPGLRDHYLFEGDAAGEPTEHTHRLAAELYGGLARIANGSDARMYALLSAGVAIAVAGYLGTRDGIHLCAPAREPADLGAGGAVFFRVRLAGARTFKDVVLSAHEGVVQAMEHPATALDAQLAAHPLGGVVRAMLTRIAVALVPFHDRRGAERVDAALSIVFHADGDGLACRLRKRPGAFDAAALALAARQLEAVLARMCHDPSSEPFAGQGATELDRELVLGAFNRPLGARPDGLVHRELEARVERFADRPAILDGELRLTYLEVDQRANRLARHLQARGVGPRDRVGVMLPRSADLVVAAFAIWKAGATYVPLDFDAPVRRIETIVQSAGLRVIVTRPGWVDRCGAAPGIVQLDAGLWRELMARPAEAIATDPGRDAVAYVIHTSGSTGQPKGVAVRHADVLTTLRHLQATYPVAAGDVFLFKSSYVFDVSMAELLGWFWEGGALAIVAQGGERDVPGLIAAIEAHAATHINFVPSLFDVFTDYLRPEHAARLATLKYVFLAGEVLRPAAVGKLAALGVRALQVNVYGPTEAAIYCCEYPIPPAAAAAAATAATVPIGRPLRGVNLFVLDEQGAIQAAGVPGELCIAGHGVALGYLDDPARTAEVFVACPHGESPRMYRTGDVCYVRPDGNLIFVGRRDSQIKLRGFRIELGEVEAALRGDPRLQECAVIARRDDRAQSAALVAFYTVAPPTPQEDLAPALDARLRELLPEYMIPQQFVRLPAIPRTAAGKLDRAALARLDLGGRVAGAGAAARPGDALEPTGDVAEILEVLRSVLGHGALGPDDDFFKAGGTSLQGIASAAELAARFPLHANDLFKARTARALARMVRDRAGAASGEQLADQLADQLARLASGDDSPHATPERAGARIEPAAGAPRPLGSVLVTGATGYLGAFLVRELLDAGARVDAIVRAGSPEAAAERLHGTLARYSPRRGWPEGRLAAIPGDLLALGDALDPVRLDAYDAVIHAAADVRHAGDEAHFHAANVVATERLLALFEGRKAAFHHISSIGVHAGLREGVLSEACGVLPDRPDSPYLRSKIAAELAVRRRGDAGAAVAIHRVGTLVFDSETGLFQHNIADNALYQQLRALWTLRTLPAGFAGTVEMTPVDLAARAVVRLAATRFPGLQMFHVYHPHPVRVAAFVDAANRRGGGIERIAEPAALRARLADRLAALGEARRQELRLFLSSLAGDRRRVDSALTQARLGSIGFTWRPIDDAALDRMLDHMLEVGFLTRPAEVAP